MVVMNDFKREYKFYKKSVDAAVRRSLASGWYILGKEVEEFERKFASYVGTKYCVGVANGLEALQISLMALGVGEGDEVLTVSNTAVATVLAISNTGATPIFVDVDEYFHFDIEDAKRKVTQNTKAIIPVHLFGQVADMEKIRKFAMENRLAVVEDACQAHGAMQNGKKAGSFADTGCFSFYPTKNLGAYGDGGAITTNSKKLYEKCLLLRNYGQENRYVHVIKGLNSRLDEMQAAILSEKLPFLDETLKMRNYIAGLYLQHLADIKFVKLPKVRENSFHAFHLFVIVVERRDELMNYLKKKGIQTIVHYPIPVHKQKCYEEFNNVGLPVTEELSKKILSLPINPFIKESEVNAICKAIKAFYK